MCVTPTILEFFPPSLVLVQGAPCRTPWCLSTAFGWLEAERAFYNPDLGSRCNSCLVFLMFQSGRLSATIVISGAIWRARGQRSYFDEIFYLGSLSFRLYSLPRALPSSLSFFSLSPPPLTIPAIIVMNYRSLICRRSLKEILMAILGFLIMCNHYYGVFFRS